MKGFNAQDRVILNKFITVLELFIEATLRTEGNATPTTNVALSFLLCVANSQSVGSFTYCDILCAAYQGTVELFVQAI